MIICCGEALIDFLPATTTQGKSAFQPFPGGSIFNVAIALGRLGANVGFLGGISSDFFGEMLAGSLLESNADLSLAIRSERPTTLAFVQISNGQPEYAFVDEGSAARMIELSDLPVIARVPTAMHFGSISLINDPCATTLEHLAREKHPDTVISIDPNIRSGMVKERASYLARLARMIGLADIIKISDEDMEWMFPGSNPERTVTQWLDGGAAMVVVTRGGEGATAYTGSHEVFQPVPKVRVADTVGAGDTFTAGLLAAIEEAACLDRKCLPELSREQIARAMELAANAASITVSRPGANPPWRHELEG